MNLNVLILMNVGLESIHVIKMLLASINKETLTANVNADSLAMDSIVRMLMNVLNPTCGRDAVDQIKNVKMFLDPSNVALVLRGRS